MKMNWFFWIQRIITWFSDLLQYKRRYLELKLNNFEAPIDYSFIPDDWDSVRADDVITGKVYDGAIQLHLDIEIYLILQFIQEDGQMQFLMK